MSNREDIGGTNVLDLHTHRRQKDVRAVVTLAPEDAVDDWPMCSVGIHPWTVDGKWRERMPMLRQQVVKPNVVAIGECGLDWLRGGSREEQLACFKAQAELAAELGKPLIVHCVKAWEELLKCRVQTRAIVHGFRGKPQLAAMLLKAGFELSFGAKFNAESLALAYEAGKMWLETDDGEVSIDEVYSLAAKALNISPTDIKVPGTIWS